MTMPPMIALDEWVASDEQSDEPESATSVSPEPGTVIGDAYRIIGPLGRGSMGVVLLAHDETLDRRVAIKFIRRNLLGTSFRERFVTEARAMARVSHPNVVQVYAFGEHCDVPYFAMEFVQGPTLEEWLAKSHAPPDLDLALRILEDICRGVSAIHAAETVHHDIKPSNILLDDKLQPRVADLGLALLFRQDRPSKHEIVGTPTYMAPEIAFSHDVDTGLRSRADVYSLACVAYELLTSRPPFDGIGNIGMLLQHATRPVPEPSSLRADLPPELDHAVLRALAKDPLERTPTVEAFRSALVAARRGNREPVRILVAEDDDDSREAMKVMLALEFANADIECVPDGLAALEAFDRKLPSVTILDLRMPRIDGIELTRLLRARDCSAAMPIIILTASGGSDEWRRLAALGADRLLLKPVIMEDVIALVRRALGERSRSALPVAIQDLSD
jgi:serine/threonine protein kinase